MGQYPFLEQPIVQMAINTSLAAAVVHTALAADKDKQKHALYGAIIAYGAKKLCQKYIFKKDNSLSCALTGAGAAFLAGILKEAYDSTGRGNVDSMDAIYTFVPGALISFSLSF